MSSRQIRKSKLEKALMQGLTEIILFEMDDERLKNEMITLTRAELNDDFSQVSVNFTCHNPEHKNKAVKLLYQTSPFFRSLLARKVVMKSIPHLKFFYDHHKGQDVSDLIDRLSAQYRQQKEGGSNLEGLSEVKGES